MRSSPIMKPGAPPFFLGLVFFLAPFWALFESDVLGPWLGPRSGKSSTKGAGASLFFFTFSGFLAGSEAVWLDGWLGCQAGPCPGRFRYCGTVSTERKFDKRLSDPCRRDAESDPRLGKSGSRLTGFWICFCGFWNCCCGGGRLVCWDDFGAPGKLGKSWSFKPAPGFEKN